jgi:hypothetical protein
MERDQRDNRIKINSWQDEGNDWFKVENESKERRRNEREREINSEVRGVGPGWVPCVSQNEKVKKSHPSISNFLPIQIKKWILTSLIIQIKFSLDFFCSFTRIFFLFPH